MKISIRENSKNYACSVVEVRDLFPIEGADKIQRCNINGNDIVVSKDVKVGDIMLYFVSGTRLSVDYCKFNNLLDKEELNSDTTKRGFISSRQFRVKAIKLRGVVSDGMLMPLSSLNMGVDTNMWGKDYLNYLKVGDEFTDINNVSLCEKYFVPVRNSGENNKKGKQAVKISRLVDNQFYLHNDTNNLRKNMDKINPNDIIGIHYKKHGTSVIIGNVLVKRPLSWLEKIAKKFKIKIDETVYDIVYSSRKVIKNGYLNPTRGEGFYGEDIWGVVAKEVGHLIPKNWTLYGEIIGYTPSGAAIQSMGGKDFDYGCQKGEYKFYVYKISVVNPDGKVIYLTDKQIEEYCEKVGLLYEDTFIYYGSVKDYMLNKGYSTKIDGWGDIFLKILEEDYNEKDCYMCANKVPEEGIVLRVEKIGVYEAYKLKSKRFILGESDAQEKEVSNIEDNQEDE